ncbi:MULTISPECIES: ABC transporter ATP-binding protein [Aerococcus]|uniref:ABC transporter ATP-binding protein n=1 Tax=Aerococcus TaxID=1375 RepID=UPI000DCE14B0|nr:MULTISPECIES: ABC transporter ATP-binding protein [Aerococcus]KAA9295937.1 ABC transporter ATP-binding protein [Aerococcus tenax]MDK6689306.1 ABC transporter ATP-binding protein [Aerococcus urinae]MDK8133732.1 ABC transporter ATP-binding protein [Aerococcus urinae]MDK8485433.1 ABC transporter ATP-binding protein [Aerococcus urinae]MDL5177784.1 ABC transporter ATP-binding protein [Aerococcus tenax]
MTVNAIEIRHFVKTYPNFKLGPINLNIPRGYIVGYIGENGSGKSTTIKAILGLINSDEGDISIFGKTNPKRSNLMDRIGVVFDDIHLPEELKIREVATFCKMVFNTWEADSFNRYLSLFELPLNQDIRSLSRGMKMKLSIAIALSHQAELLILDEPTSGLDPVVRNEILDILLDFVQNENHTVLISSHILSDLEKAADYITFLHDGKIYFMEEKDRLIESYALCSVDEDTAKSIDPAAIIGRRKHSFGQELLVKRNLMPSGIPLTKPSIEDIMVYTIKEDHNESANL